MDSVIFDGVEYVKASVAAKQFRYTADYVGQLCRGKKVDARLVGRTWYVNPDSLKQHRQKRHKTKVKIAKQKTEVAERKLSVSEGVAERPVSRRVREVESVRPSPKKTNISLTDDDKRRLVVFYEADDEQLIPKLHKKTQPAKTVRVEQVNPNKVQISSRKKETSFSPTAMPEVALSGKLRITSFPDQASYDELPTDGVSPTEAGRDIQKADDIANNYNAISPERDKKSTSEKSSVKTKIAKQTGSVVAMTRRNKKLAIESESPGMKDDEVVVSKLASSSGSPSKQSAKTAKTAEQVSFVPVSTQYQEELTAWERFSPVIATVCALFCVGLLWSASTVVTAVGAEYDSEVVLQVANLLEIIHQP